jgi:glutathione peroxidase
MTSNIHDLPLKRIDGSDARLADYRGKVLLIVNVASKCGLTPQYEGLEALYRAKHAQGLEVLGFPANDFKGQEPGSDAEIASFCSTQYDVSFPMFSKIGVTGAGKHPLYAALIQAQPEARDSAGMRDKLQGLGIPTTEAPEVLWNFEKFLVARDGSVVARFSPDMKPDDSRLTDAIDRELARTA